MDRVELLTPSTSIDDQQLLLDDAAPALKNKGARREYFIQRFAQNTGRDEATVKAWLAEAGKNGKAVRIATDQDSTERSLARRTAPFSSPDEAYAALGAEYYVLKKYYGSGAVRTHGSDEAYAYNKFMESFRNLKCHTIDESGEPCVAPAVPLFIWSGVDHIYDHETYHPIGVNEGDGDKVARENNARNVLNTWGGFACRLAPIADYENIGDALNRECPMITQYLWQIMSSQRLHVLQYVVKWMADAIKNPRRVDRRTAIILRSDNEGTGKTTFALLVAGMFLPQNVNTAVSYTALTNRFTTPLENRAILGSNEFFMPHENMRGISAVEVEAALARVYDLIDSPTLTGERKNKDAIVIHNYSRLALSSNKSILIPRAKKGARRLVVLNVPDDMKIDLPGITAEQKAERTKFWVKLYDAIDHKDRDANGFGELDRFFTILSRIDLTDWSPQGNAPAVAEQAEQLQLAADAPTRALQMMLDHGRLEGVCSVGTGVSMVHVHQDSIRREIERWLPGHDLNLTQTGFAKKYMHQFAIGQSLLKRHPTVASPVRGFLIPQLAKCREIFEAKFLGGAKVQWTNDLTLWNEAGPAEEDQAALAAATMKFGE